MNVLLIRPDPGNERFGLGPFFRVEPLGLEYVATALRAHGARPTLVDERFARGPWIRRSRARMVGISCMHALEYDRVLEVARAVRRSVPGVFILVGGHTAAAYPAPLETLDVDAICLDDAVWQRYERTFRERPTASVIEDLASVGVLDAALALPVR